MDIRAPLLKPPHVNSTAVNAAAVAIIESMALHLHFRMARPA